MSRRRWRAGVGLVVLYGAVAAITQGLASRPLRPLFDGFAPPAPYRWVRPPPEFSAGNVPPERAQRDIPLGPQGSEATNASTNDAQIILTLPAGAVPANPPDTTAALTITPLDAGTLAPLAAPLRPVTNAYRIQLVYQPSQTPVPPVGGAIIALTAASQGEALLYSPDGTQWRTTPSRPFGNTHGLTGTFSGPGYYLVAAPPTPPATEDSGTSPGTAGLFAAALVGAGGVVVLAVVLLRRRGAGRGGHAGRPRGSGGGRGADRQASGKGGRRGGQQGGKGAGKAGRRRRAARRRRS